MAATGDREGAVGDNPCAIAWAAGLFEGEGCIIVQRSREGGRAYLNLTVQMTDLDVLERFREVLGIEAKIRISKRTALRERDRKTIYNLTVAGAAGLPVAELLRPWLGERRRQRLDEALAEIEANPPLKYRYATAEEMKEARRLYAGGSMSLQKVAEHLGIGVGSVRRAVHEEKVVVPLGAAARISAL